MEFLKHKTLTLALAVVSGAAMAAPRIEVHGHRGARARFPENTIPAFEYALKAGVDFLEMDLAVTKDNQVVVIHDPDFNPDICLDENGKPISRGLFIHNMTLAEVKKYDCGAKKNPNFPEQIPVPGTKVPTLDEVFEMVEHSTLPNAKTVRFNIETKSDFRHPEQSPPPHEFSEMALKIIKKHKMLSRTVLQSFDHRTLTEAKKIDHKIKISALTEKEDTGIDYPKIIKEIKPEYLSPKGDEITPADIKYAHDHRVKVIPWTLNKPEQWEAAIKAGVDGIISDDPENLIAYLKEHKLR